jgi:outer membrane porin, OprD family
LPLLDRSEEKASAAGALGWVLVLAASTPGAWAGQNELNEGVAPESAQQASTPLERAFEKVPGGLQLNAITDWTRKKLQDTTPFIRDTELTFKPRTYFFYQDKATATQSPTDPADCISGDEQCPAATHAKEEAWAIGGSIEYKSGWLFDHFRVGAEYFASWPLYTGPNAGDTLLLTPSGGSYTVLGQAYAQLKFWDQVLTAGESEYGTPYVNRQFNRMTPNTFEGVSLKGSFTGLRGKDFDYLVGYLSKIKQRNSTEFIPMSQVLGTADKYYGTYIAQFLFTAWGASIGLSEYYTPQNLNIFYAEAAWAPKVSGSYGLKVSVQFTAQRAVGSESLTDSLQSVPLASNAGARATFSYERSVLSLAYSLTAPQGAIVNPWGSSPSYTNGSIRNVNRPNEQAALLNYSYEFQKLGFPGLSAIAIYSYGWNAKDPTTSQRLSNQWELDLVADYRVPQAIFKGVWFRLQRNQLQNAGDTNATTQWRAIVYWETPLI